jgi:hypothetical protein
MQSAKRNAPKFGDRKKLADGIRLLTVFSGGNQYVFSRATGSKIECDSPSKGTCPSNLSGIDRVILHDENTGDVLLVLDVVADAHSQASWSASGVEVNSAVRCYLETVGHLELRIRCDYRGVYELGLKSVFTYLDIFSEKYKTLADALKNAELKFTKAATFSSNLLFTVAPGFDLGGPPCSMNPGPAPLLYVRFPSATDLAANAQQYFLQIDTTIPASDCDQRFSVPAYFESGSGGAIKSSDVSVDNSIKWVFVQRPTLNSLEAVQKSRELWTGSGQWVLEFIGVLPESVYEEQIKQKFNPCARSYIAAVKAVSGGLSVSFIPEITRLSGSPWAIIYNISDYSATRDYGRNEVVVATHTPKPGSIVVEPSALIPGGSGTIEATLTQCVATNGSTVSIQIDIDSPVRWRREQLRGLAIHANAPAFSKNEAPLRMGSLNVVLRGGGTAGLKSPPSSEWMLRCNPDGSVSAEVDAFFYVNKILPGGQDDVPGEQYTPENAIVSAGPCSVVTDSESTDAYVESRFSRARPLVIPLRTNKEEGSFLLRVREQTSARASRTLRFDLHNADISGQVVPEKASKKKTLQASRPDSVLILDRDSFLVAKVDYTALTSLAKRGGSLIAQWSNSSVDGAGWQIRTEAEPFDLYLPPQAVGESMVKDQNFTLPADYRLGYPTHIQLDNAYFQQRFGEVPWNLRRLLGYPGQRDPGSALRYLEFELIYGLTCDSKLPFVRLAEVTALAGAIPGRMPPVLRSQWASDEDALIYDSSRKQWADDYSRYLTRLGILEPWDSHVEGSLILKNLSCEIRYPQTDQAYPKSTRHAADLADPINPVGPPGTGPLRGGVTWGFESQNVFSAVLRNLESTSASVSDLYLSSLGGWGHQQASFDEGRTTLYGDAAMGRTYYYKLERIGRIAVWWNRAKHVIVYERSVVPSRQFYLEQGKDTYGVPLLRKVEEYIEILDEERRYPDDKSVSAGSSTSPEAEKLADRRCGFVAACVFPKGTRIKVSGSWGTDVDATGWKVPLWKKGAFPPDVYPFPKVSLSMRSQFGDSDPEAPFDIADPENLYFYTDTRPGTGDDPDAWTPVLNVDYVDLPRPRPGSDFEQGNPQQLSPTEISIPGGFRPCTFLLKPPLRPANLTANRVDKPMAAVLDSVTLLRAKFKETENQFTGDAAKLARLHSEITAAWKQVLVAAAASNFDFKLVSDAIDAQFDTWFGAYLQDYADLKAAITNKAADLAASVVSYETSAIDKLKNQIRYGLSVPPQVGQITSGTERILQDVKDAISHPPGGAITPDYLKNIVTMQFGALQERVLHTNSAPGLLASALKPYAEGAKAIIRALDDQVDAFLQLLGSATQIEENTRIALIARIAACKNELDALWSAANVRLQPWLPILQEAIEAKLPSFITAWRNQAIQDLNAASDELQKVAADLNKIRSSLRQSKARFDQSIQQSIDDFSNQVASFLDKFVVDTTLLCDPAECQPPFSWANQSWNVLVQLASQGDAQGLINKFNELLQYGNASVNNLFKQIDQLQQNLTTQTRNLQNYVVQQLAAPLQDLELVTKQNVKDWLKNRSSDVRKALEDLRDQTAGAVQGYFGRYIELLRSVAPPIATDVSSLLSLVRAFGDPPRTPSLDFARDKLAYFFGELPQIGISPSLGSLLQPSTILGGLNALNISLPTLSLGDRLLPADLSQFDLSKIFPGFAGIDLSNLFQKLKMSSLANENVKITHGVDPQSKSAWAQADITEKVDDTPIFDGGPLSLCDSRPPHSPAWSELKEDWERLPSIRRPE